MNRREETAPEQPTALLDERGDAAQPRLDEGPPPDPDSPFAEEHARRSRRTAETVSVRSRGRALLAWLAALAIVAAAVYGGIWLTGYRLAGASSLSIGTATLTTEQVAVPAPGNGQVAQVLVHPGEQVGRGSPLVRVRVFGTSAAGSPTTTPATVPAPISGVVASVGAPDGSAVRAGGPLVTMYSPGGQTFEATVDTATVSRLRRGMHVRLTSPAVSGSIAAVVDHVVSPLQDSTSPQQPAPASGQFTLVLRPLEPRRVRNLAPGLQFDAVVDTASAPRGAPQIAQVSR